MLRPGSDEEGEEEKKEDQSDDEEIHIEAEQDAGVVEAPAALHAAGGVRSAGESAEGWEDDPEGGAQVRRMRKQDGDGQAGEDENVSPDQRRRARVEDARRQETSLVLWGHSGSSED